MGEKKYCIKRKVNPSEVVHHVKAIAVQASGPGLTPRTHLKVEGECWHHKLSSDLHMYTMTHAYSHTHKITFWNEVWVWYVVWRKWMGVKGGYYRQEWPEMALLKRWQLSLISKKDEWHQLWEDQEVRHFKPSIAACRGRTAAQWGNVIIAVSWEPALCQMPWYSSVSYYHNLPFPHASYSLGNVRMGRAAALEETPPIKIADPLFGKGLIWGLMRRIGNIYLWL